MMPNMIGRYRIKAELGRGGMSTVYLAHDPLFDRDVAIKLLPLELLHQPTFRRRFEREAKVVAALEHPAIVPVYDFGENEGQPFLVMRFMTGGSLSERLNQGAISLTESAQIISYLAPALDEVHAHGVIHRDLKPSNILFDQRGMPFISDFGTAKLQDAQTKLTDTGGAVGTPAYMSPEQIQANEDLDGRSDIYTLGVILFEMLSGSHPFETNTPIAIAVKHMFEPVPRLLDMDPNLPANCQAVIAKAMAKKKEDRYQTAVAFAAEFTAVVDQLQAGELALVQPEVEKGRRLALLIGNSQYKAEGLSKLIAPPSSIHDVADVLMNPEIGAYEEVLTLVDEPAEAIRRAVAQFYANKTVDDQLLLYFMGHAALGKHGRIYLIANDTDPSLLRGTSIPTAFIADEMDNSQSQKQIFVLDCHYSDTAPSETPNLVGRSIDTAETFSRNGHQRVVVTAYDSTEYNWNNGHVSGKAEPSQFSRYFVDGLRSGAADANEDGKITIGELFNFVQDQIATKVSSGKHQPRKWTPNFIQSSDDIVVGRAPLNAPSPISQVVLPQSQLAKAPILSIPTEDDAKAQFTSESSPKFWNRKVTKWALAVTGFFLMFILFGGFTTASLNKEPSDENSVVAITETKAATAVSTPTPIPPTAVPPTAEPTQEVLPTVTPTIIEPTATEVVEDGEDEAETAVALLSSSIFDFPDTDADELTFIGVGDKVTVLGRAELGNWLYVQTEEGIEGFIHGPRVDYAGDVAALTIQTPSGTFVANTSTCSENGCASLIMDAYPILGTRCEGGNRYRTIYLSGNGGNGSYTYYWNGEKVAGPQTDGFGFEVNGGSDGRVIGTGKIISGDGQTVEKELFIDDFSCN